MAKILVCDDSMFMRMMVKKILVGNGHTIVGEAGNGREAVTLYQNLKPDVVTMDITMPELDGVSAVREILARDPKAHIVMVSAIGQKDVVTEAIDAGAMDFIVKPFEPENVIEIIENVLTKHK
ncbi:MAG: response regulator receiver protein [Firmicutes bacterium]|nr:response regulator receiver protein [Bacillota bacterium]